MTDNVNDFLAHHGVKGMKWGKRKAERAESKSLRKAALKVARQDFKDNFNARYDISKNAGDNRKKGIARSVAIVPDILYAGGMYTGSQITRSAGYSKGMSAAIALTTGMPGSVIASEIRIRKTARQAVS